MQDDRLSLSVINPLLNLRSPRRVPIGFNSREGQGEELAANVSISAGVSAAQWPQIATSVGDTLARLDRLSEALGYFQMALSLERAEPVRKKLNDEISEARDRLSREQTNLSRAPILHQALEQQSAVRPKLVQTAETGGQKP